MSHRPVPEVVAVGMKLEYAPAPERLPEHLAPIWDEVVPPLVGSNLIREVDYQMLEMMVGFIHRARQARDQLNEQPLLLRGRKKGMVRNPLFQIERDSWLAAQKIASLFGMTPADRARLGLAQVQGMTLAQELEARLDKDAADVPDEIEVPDDLVTELP